MKSEKYQMLQWFIETYKRLGEKTPPYQKILIIIGLIAALVAQLPDLIQLVGIPLKEEWEKTFKIIVTTAGITASFVAKLAVQNSTAVVLQVDGTKEVVVKETLPFTANVEIKKAEVVNSEMEDQDAKPSVTVSKAPTEVVENISK